MQGRMEGYDLDGAMVSSAFSELPCDPGGPAAQGMADGERGGSGSASDGGSSTLGGMT